MTGATRGGLGRVTNRAPGGVVQAALLSTLPALWVVFLGVLGTPGCTSGEGPPLFEEAALEAGIDFVHVTGARGERHLPEVTVGGAGWIDFDRDGFYDLYLVNGNEHPDTGAPGTASNRLYRNRGDGTFEDVTERAGVGHRGYGSGVACGDFDNDGWTDLYVTNFGPDVLYRNRGDGTFEDVTGKAGIDASGWSSSAAFLDYDGDGLLDLYVARYVDYRPGKRCAVGGYPTYCGPQDFEGLPDKLYRNRGDGTFEDVSERAGVAIGGPEDGKSLGVVVFDLGEDGDSDIYVACDQVRNLLFENLGDGTFREIGLEADVAYSREGVAQAGMGVDAGDVDLDGLEDLVVTNFADEPCALYLARGSGLFEDASVAFGLGGPTLPTLGFGCVLFDFDLDGDLDLYVANGHVHDNVHLWRPDQTFAQRDQLFANDAGRRFQEVSARGGSWFSVAAVGRAVASADYDNDGDVDLVVLNAGGRPALLRNEAPRGRWLGVCLEGTRSNRDGYGARVSLEYRRGDALITRSYTYRSARSYAAACDPRLRIGLGSGVREVRKLTVRWPSGTLQTLERPQLDREHLLREP